MFDTIKNYIYAGIGIISIFILFSLNHYYEKSNELTKQIKNLNQNVFDLENKIVSKNKEISNIKNDVNRQSKELLEISKKSNDYKNEVKIIEDKYNKSRLEKIASKKPKLLQKVFNNAIKKEIEELNNLTKNKRD